MSKPNRNGSITYDWQAWYGQTYDRILIRNEGEIESGRFKDARNELLWAHAVSAFLDTQLGLRYDSGKGTDRGWLTFGVQGFAPYWLYVEANAYLISKMLQLAKKTSFRQGLPEPRGQGRQPKTHPCALDTGDPRRYHDLAEASC